jgi:hypothetical protein
MSKRPKAWAVISTRNFSKAFARLRGGKNELTLQSLLKLHRQVMGIAEGRRIGWFS